MSEENIEERHRRETEELEAKINQMLAGVKGKNERKRINKQAEQMRRDLFDKQQEELEEPMEEQTRKSIETESQPVQVPPPQEEKPKKDLEAARQKRMKKQQKKYALQSEIANIMNSTQTRGQKEIENVNNQLKALNLKMHSIIGDGNCMYRAIAYSLQIIGLIEYKDINSYKVLRQRCANELRAHIDDYMPFSNCSSPEEFENHCIRVESSSDWGDELELMALSKALNYTFIIHREGEQPSKRGDSQTTLQLAFLRYYTSSGGHYNSVIPIDTVE